MDSAMKKSIGFLFLSSFIGCSFSNQPPNIVFILADDLGWNDVGFHGSNEVSTPNIDALAYSGVILRSHYSESLCTPSRAALLTGRYPIHTGTQHNVILAASPWGLSLSQKTFPQHLAPLGYSSHAIGKWHLGFFQKDYTPTYRGFDSHYGLWNGYHDYFTHTTQASFSPFEGYDLRRNLDVDWAGSGKYTTRLLTDEAERLIDNHNISRPLFLYMAHLAVHAGSWEKPLQAPDSTINRFSPTKSLERRTFLGMLWELDQSVGRLVNALRRKGIIDNTIIVFVSDNGAATRGIHKNTGSNFPLRGEKGTSWEGGVRTASFIWSKMLKKQRAVLDGMMHISDWLPTLYNAAGGNSKDLGNIDGVNQWKYINGAEKSPRKEILHNIDDIYGYSALRLGDYKYVNGSILFGNLDDWFGIPEDPNESYNVTAILESDVGRILDLNIETVQQLRTATTITCTTRGVKESRWADESNKSPSDPEGLSPNEDSRRKKRWSVIMKNDELKKLKPAGNNPCNPLSEVCLFNIVKDPCELNNLAHTYPEKVRELEKRLVELRKSMVKPSNVRVESIANPGLYNNTWTFWRDLTPSDLLPPIISVI